MKLVTVESKTFIVGTGRPLMGIAALTGTAPSVIARAARMLRMS